MLLKHGAEIDSKENENQTPLHVAIANNNKEIANLLCFYGADL